MPSLWRRGAATTTGEPPAIPSRWQVTRALSMQASGCESRIGDHSHADEVTRRRRHPVLHRLTGSCAPGLEQKHDIRTHDRASIYCGVCGGRLLGRANPFRMASLKNSSEQREELLHWDSATSRIRSAQFPAIQSTSTDRLSPRAGASPARTFPPAHPSPAGALNLRP